MSTFVQDSLIDAQPLVRPTGATIQERFESFHTGNGWIYRAFESLIEAWLAKGNTRVGMKALGEKVRWEYGMRVSPNERFALNNDYLSRYARLLIAEHPELEGVILTRELRAA